MVRFLFSFICCCCLDPGCFVVHRCCVDAAPTWPDLDCPSCLRLGMSLNFFQFPPQPYTPACTLPVPAPVHTILWQARSAMQHSCPIPSFLLFPSLAGTSDWSSLACPRKPKELSGPSPCVDAGGTCVLAHDGYYSVRVGTVLCLRPLFLLRQFCRASVPGTQHALCCAALGCCVRVCSWFICQHVNMS